MGFCEVLFLAARPRPAIDESRKLEVGAGLKGMRLKRGQARVNRLAICVILIRVDSRFC